MEANLNLLIYVSVFAIILAVIGYIAIFVDLYSDRLRSLWTRYMDRGDKSLGRKEKVIVEYEAPDVNDLPEITTRHQDLPPICGNTTVQDLEMEMKRMRNEQERQKAASIEPEWTDEGLKITVTQHDGSKTLIEYDGETTKEIEDDFGMDFLSDKFKEGDKKVANGEISCNLDNPEDCINCGS